jgi:hypothetical protein
MSKNSKQLLHTDRTNQYILVGLTVVSVFLAFGFWQNPLTVYDAAGHVSLIRTIASDFWPKMAGWNANELLGWPQGVFYPPLFHWLAASLSFFVSTQTAIKLLISAAMIALPGSIYYFSRSIIQDKRWVAVNTTVLFLLVLLFPNFLGTGTRALFQIGLLSNFFVLPLLFLFLASMHRGKSYLVTGLLLALIALTHIVAAIVAGLYLIAVVKVKFLLGRLTRRLLINYLKTLVLAAILSAFFWIPFALNLEYTSVSRHVSSYFLPNMVVFAASTLLGFYGWRRKQENIFILAGFTAFVSFVAAIDAFLIRNNGTSFALYQFHIYRFQPFAYLLLAAAVVIVASKYVKFDRWGFLSQSVLLGGLGLIVLVLLARNPSQLPNAEFEIENPEVVKGRFLETFRRTESDPFWYGLQTEVNAENQEVSWAYGLFTDSSPNGPYLGSLIRSLRPYAYLEGEEVFIETKTVDEEKVSQLIHFFGINYLVHLDGTKGEAIGTLHKGSGELLPARSIEGFYAERITRAKIFDVVRLPLKVVKKDWNMEVEKWWTREGEIAEVPYLENGSEISKAEKKNLQSAQVEVVESDQKGTSHKLNVKSDGPVPVLAKISYFPYWKAFQNGKEIPIYRAAPNLMLFKAKGEVELAYKEPVWINWLYIVSVATFFTTIFLIYRQKPGSK